MNTAIYGGAFNPVHNGHLHLIEELCCADAGPAIIDRLILVPTAIPPHKSSSGLADGSDRINMLRLAVDGLPCADKIEISTIEFESSDKSYTYITLKKLKRIYPDDKFFLLMGSDQFLSFKSWYAYKKIVQLAEICAITREDSEQDAVSRFLHDNQDVFLHRASIMTSNPVIVSSTDIRNRVRAGESISTLVPPPVEKYIREHGLYV